MEKSSQFVCTIRSAKVGDLQGNPIENGGLIYYRKLTVSVKIWKIGGRQHNGRPFGSEDCRRKSATLGIRKKIFLVIL